MKIIKQLKYYSKVTPDLNAIEGDYFNSNYKNLYLIVKNIQNFLQSIPNLKCLIIFGEKKSLAYPIMLACLKSKITYVPLNSDTPNYRINKILEITKSQLFISVSNKSIKIKKIKFFKINDFNFLKKSNFLKRNHNRNNNIAYIIFTSGSTGNPKGVKISYKALDYYCNWLKKKFKVFKKMFSIFRNQL